MDNILQKIKSISGQMWFYIIFSIFWVGILALDYLNKEMIYGPSLYYFRYYFLSLFVLFTATGVAGYYTKKWFFARFKGSFVNGLMIFGLFVIFIWSITISFNKYWGAPLGLYNYFHLLKMAIYTIGISFLLLTASYAAGHLLRKLLFTETREAPLTFGLLDISLGLMMYQLLLLGFGAYNLLDPWIMSGILGVMLLSDYSASWSFAKKCLITKIPIPEKMGFWGLFTFVLLLFYLTMNYLYTQSPFPLGFDARNVYINISRLIGDADGIIEGFPPYSWGLIQATGYLLVDSPEVTLFISSLGGILAIFGMYELASRYLKLSPSYALFIGLLFVLIPAVNNHWIIEFKIDLGLLFVQLTMINFLLYWLTSRNTSSDPSMLNTFSKSDYSALIILGLLCGFTISIKALSIFLILGLVVVIWHFHQDKFGAIGLTAAALGAVILVKLDELSGMRGYHLAPDETGIALIVVGGSLLLFSLIQNNVRFLRSARSAAIIGIFTLVSFSPWVYKNYHYTKSLSVMKLVLGQKPEPPFHLWILERNYEKLMKARQEADGEQ